VQCGQGFGADPCVFKELALAPSVPYQGQEATEMKTKLMAVLLMAGGALIAAPQVAVGVQFGGPGPEMVRGYRPPCPGPGYIWIDGYYDAYGNWFDGYWALPPYEGAYWIAPRFYGGRFVAGYWGGSRGYRRYDDHFDRGRAYYGGGHFDNRGGGGHFDNRGGGGYFDNRGGGNHFDNRGGGNHFDNRGGGNHFDNRGGNPGGNRGGGNGHGRR
jgi:hypothetical protein